MRDVVDRLARAGRRGRRVCAARRRRAQRALGADPRRPDRPAGRACRGWPTARRSAPRCSPRSPPACEPALARRRRLVARRRSGDRARSGATRRLRRRLWRYRRSVLGLKPMFRGARDGAGARRSMSRLLAGAFARPRGRRAAGRVPIRTVVIEASLAGPRGRAGGAARARRRLAVVSDPTTHARARARASSGRSARSPRSRASSCPSTRRPTSRPSTRLRAGDGRRRCAGRGRLRHHQRPLQIRGRVDGKPYVGVRDRALDERLHLGQRRDHRATATRSRSPRRAGRGGLLRSRACWRRRRSA